MSQPRKALPGSTPPDRVTIVREHPGQPEPAHRDGDQEGERFSVAGVAVTVRPHNRALEHPHDRALDVSIEAPGTPLSRVGLHWRLDLAPGALVLGDAWERSYGELAWSPVGPERVLPWSFLAYDPGSRTTVGSGVRVQAHAMCRWSLEPGEPGEPGVVTLWLDVRNGGSPVLLADRALAAATVVSVEGGPGQSAYSVQQSLTDAMKPENPLPARHPIVGCNNWYYAYGENFGPAEILRDAETIVELAGGHPERPYCVVDAGWSPGGVCPGGPWTAGVPGLFDDMPLLARDIAARGARPGIWMRPAALSSVDDPARLRPGPRPVPEQPLDLTVPDNLATIREDVKRLVGWGFELVKHDFSTYDLFARWGPEMAAELTAPGWHHRDRTRTNAEILLDLYRAVRSGAGDATVIGCNTVGHLAAGLVEAQRIGDDTSGRDWARTRTMGVNTLAFRLAQHGRFFVADADCVPCTPATPWERNRQFLDLVARSGTALFVSVDPGARTSSVDADLRAALRLALDGGTPGGIEPLDWFETATPTRWRAPDGTVQAYDWGQAST